MATALSNTANIVGVAGTPPTGLITYLTAQAYLDAEGAPRDGRRSCIVEPFTEPPLPNDADEYIVYRRNSMNFITQRNHRITNWANAQ